MAYLKKYNEDYYLGNPNLPTADTEFEWTPKMLRELKKCKQNILYFAENFFHIVHPDKGRQKIKLFPYQKKILRSLRDNRFLIVLSSRQSGKTTMMTIFALWIVCFNEDQRVLIVANKEATAINIFKRIRLAYEMLPNYLKSGVGEYAKTSMTLANGSSIGISTTSSDAGRGETVNCLIVDEMAFVPKELVDDFWSAVYPIISASKKSKIFIASTPNGTDNLFYELYKNAEKGVNNWWSERVDWWEVPGRDEKWKENTIKEIGSIEAFQQEYENKFHQSGEASAPEDIIDKLRLNCREPRWLFDDGHYKIWEEPNPEAIYVAGVDVGEGVNEAASAVHIFDISNLTDIRQVAIYHNRKITPVQFAPKLFEILQNWGSPPVAIERNNCGAHIVDTLRNIHNYEYIINYAPKEEEKRLGCISHTNTKYKGVINMRYWINQLNAIVLRDIDTVHELKDFVRYPNGTWAARPGPNMWDDRVMAMVWALIILDPIVTEKFFEIIKYDEFKKPLVIKRLDFESKRDFNNPISSYVNEKQDTEGYRILPIVFGNKEFDMNPQNPDIEELEQMGWKSLV